MTQPYQPANGTEGMDFMDAWCERCLKDKGMRQKPQRDGCEIIAMSLVCGVSDPEYPKELIEDDGGNPRCTAFMEDPDPEGQDDITMLRRRKAAYDALPRDPISGRPVIA